MTASTARPFWGKIAPALVVLGFLAFMLLFFPFRNRFQFDGDEGINLMKASLVAKDYPLYDQIWSDQPPLLTYFLVAVFRLFGAEVNVARLLILFFSAVLLLASYLILRLIWGDLHALAGTFLIIILPTYMRLSVSVMVGLPSITFAMLSLLAVVLWHKQRKPLWLVLSALAMSVSVLIKIFTGYLVPIIGLGLLVNEFVRMRGRLRLWDLIWPAGLWAVIFGALTAAAILIWVGVGNLDQLVESHIQAEGLFNNQIYTINYHLQDSKLLLLLSLFGAGFAIIGRRWLSLYLIAWAGTAYVLLLRHSPVWYHHQLLVTLPAAMLGGIAFAEAIQALLSAYRNHQLFTARSLLAVLALVSFAAVLFDQVPDVAQYPPRLKFGSNFVQKPLQATEIFTGMYEKAQEYGPRSQWMVTDLPMLAFRLGMKVPPNLVVFSNKRFKTDLIADGELYKAIETYQPEEVMVLKPIRGWDAYLSPNYQLVYTRRNMHLYIRDDIYFQVEAAP